jgi:polyisoprenoid-binding protein YceI
MTAARTATVEVPPAGTYRIDPQRSTVSYSGRHMFGLGAVHATFTIRSGELQITDPPSRSSTRVLIDADSFSSGNPSWDKDVRSAALLDTAAYPGITFIADNLRNNGDSWALTGAVTAHGKTVPVELKIDRAAREGSAMRVHARAAHLDRYAFGVVNKKGMVGRYLDLDLDVYAVPA